MKKSNAQNRLKPILFNTEMVQAILSGEKTCTRRIAKREKSPFAVGDILYVREKGCIFSEPAKLLNFLTTDGSKDTGF